MTSAAPRIANVRGTSWRSCLDPLAIARHLWSLRDLIGQLTRRELDTLYRGSVLGIFWALIQPLVLLGVYVVFFVYMLPESPVTEAKVLGMFCALLVFNLFVEAISRAPQLVIGNPSYVKRIVFPLEVLPLSVLGALVVNFALGVVVLILARLWMLGGVPPTVLLLPVLMAPLLVLVTGVCWFLASLGVFLRDTAQFVRAITIPLMFLTPIFYSINEKMSSQVQFCLHLNPLTYVIEASRAVVIHGTAPDWSEWGIYTAVAILIACCGHAWFMKTRDGFADVI